MEPRSFDAIVSLGATCQTAQQIRAHFGEHGSHVFDWMFASFQGVIDAVEADFDGVFALDRLCVRPDRYTVDIQGAGLSIHHLFPRDEAGLIIAGAVPAHYDEVSAKLAYLVDKWRTLASRRVLYVIQIWKNADLEPATADLRGELERLCAALRARHTAAFALLAVSSADAREPDWEQSEIVHRSLPLYPEVERWGQNRSQWARVFQEVARLDPAGDRRDGVPKKVGLRLPRLARAILAPAGRPREAGGRG